jgi:hypothetical protein
MEIRAQVFPWAPFRKLLARITDKNGNKQAPIRTTLFQLIENEVSTADALLDLEDLAGCDRHMSYAVGPASELRGPESLIMHQRLRDLRSKRTVFKKLR